MYSFFTMCVYVCVWVVSSNKRFIGFVNKVGKMWILIFARIFIPSPKLMRNSLQREIKIETMNEKSKWLKKNGELETETMDSHTFTLSNFQFQA